MSRKKKKKSFHKKGSSFNLGKYIIEQGRKLPLFKLYLDETIYNNGIGYCIVSRKKSDDEIIYANFLVDRFCLGIKDVYYDMVSQEEFEEIIEEFNSESETNLIEKDSNYIFNMIYGAMEYGYENGFDPHPDFDFAEYLLEDVDKVEYIDLEFGVEGKPLFIAGPKDKSGRIISTLKKVRGEGNFDFVLYSQVLAMQQEEELDDEEE